MLNGSEEKRNPETEILHQGSNHWQLQYVTPLTPRPSKCQDTSSGCQYSPWICQEGVLKILWFLSGLGIAQKFLLNLSGLPSGFVAYIQGSY